VIVDSAVYRRGNRIPVDCAPGDYHDLRQQASGEGDFVWVGLHEPSEAELEDVAIAFGLHPLAVEDALNAHQRPKLERYEDSLFLILKTLWYVDATDQVETGEINMFIGPDFVITVRHGEGGGLQEARKWLEGREHILANGPFAVVYAVCDQIVDHYELVANELEVDVDEVEASVFSAERTRDSARIYVLKRELAEMRRAVLPLKAPLARFASGAEHGVHADAAPYFRDVGDHLARIAETVDNLDTLLSTAFDAHIAQISVQQNDDMRRISALVGLIAAPTVIGSIYGMNFDHMPELHWLLGYPFALLLMFASSLTVWIISKRAGWL
jgi:magnesium transporter